MNELLSRFLKKKQQKIHPEMNLRSFKQKSRWHRPALRRFLSSLVRKTPRGLDTLAAEADKKVWKEVDCLQCANCCKTMSPTYTQTDIRRISSFLGMSKQAFIKKWLYKDRNGDWLNKKTPCQFLDLSNNMCRIYEVRPKDCAGFPHHTKRKLTDYDHVYKQNLEYCPATYRWVELMREMTGFNS